MATPPDIQIKIVDDNITFLALSGFIRICKSLQDYLEVRLEVQEIGSSVLLAFKRTDAECLEMLINPFALSLSKGSPQTEE